MKKLLLGAVAGAALALAVTGWIASPPAPGGDIRIALECRGIEKEPFRTNITVEQYEADAAKRHAAWDKAPDMTEATLNRLRQFEKTLPYYDGVKTYFDHATISVEKGRVVAAEAGMWNGVITVATPTRIEFEARKWSNMPDGPMRYGVIDRTTGNVDIHDNPMTYPSVDNYKTASEVAFDFRCHPAATKF
jgi:hypothetical protein